MNDIEKCNSYELGQLSKELGQLAKGILRNECYRRHESVCRKISKLENQLRLLNAENAELIRVLKMLAD